MGWWGKPSEPTVVSQPESKPESSPNSTQDRSFDPEKLPELKKLPKKLQEVIDRADQDSSFFDNLKDG